MSKIQVITSRSFSDYYLCPSLYYYRHLHNYKEIFDFASKESKAGETVHRLIENTLKNLKPLAEDFSDEQIREAMIYFHDKYAFLKEYEVCCEWSFHFPILYKQDRLVLSGRIDCYYTFENRVVLIDWKTTLRRTRLTELLNNLQLEFYAYVLAKIKKLSVVEVRTVYLNLRKETVRILEENDLQLTEKKLFSLIDATKKGIFPAMPLKFNADASLCSICHFESLCETYI